MKLQKGGCPTAEESIGGLSRMAPKGSARSFYRSHDKLFQMSGIDVRNFGECASAPGLGPGLLAEIVLCSEQDWKGKGWPDLDPQNR